MRGGAMRITKSAAKALKASPPAKTNPITRLRIILSTLRALAVHVRGRMQTRDMPKGGNAGTGKSCTQVHEFLLPVSRRNDSAQSWSGTKSATSFTETNT
jgi:hypothetical protein